jgi:SAM-dependent methyltransferase
MSPGQDKTAIARNREFFSGPEYARQIAELDSYSLIREAISREVDGLEHLLDVGNGGVFEYDTSRVGEIVAVDLFLHRLPPSHFPPNVDPRRGDALALDLEDGSQDAVLEAFLFHHLVGKDPAACIENVRRAIAEAHRVLAPGGRLIVAESCVPAWFYPLERALFRPLAALARTRALGGHPATLQLPFPLLVELVSERFEIEHSYRIGVGRWLSQFGRRWPSALTPARPYMIVARKRNQAP